PRQAPRTDAFAGIARRGGFSQPLRGLAATRAFRPGPGRLACRRRLRGLGVPRPIPSWSRRFSGHGWSPRRALYRASRTGDSRPGSIEARRSLLRPAKARPAVAASNRSPAMGLSRDAARSEPRSAPAVVRREPRAEAQREPRVAAQREPRVAAPQRAWEPQP